VTQSNAAAAEESAAASEELSAQSAMMKGSVGQLLEMVDGKEGAGTLRPEAGRLKRPFSGQALVGKKLLPAPRR
jgi:methyl-accepting chemotaxis protein